MVYDVRKELDMVRLDRQTSINSPADASGPQSPRLGSESARGKAKAKPWANLWKEKRQNNANYLLAAEEGNM